MLALFPLWIFIPIILQYSHLMSGQHVRGVQNRGFFFGQDLSSNYVIYLAVPIVPRIQYNSELANASRSSAGCVYIQQDKSLFWLAFDLRNSFEYANVQRGLACRLLASLFGARSRLRTQYSSSVAYHPPSSVPSFSPAVSVAFVEPFTSK
jgi:hypothetical protein